MEVIDRVRAIEERIAAGAARTEAARASSRPCCHCEVGDVPLNATAEEQSHLRVAVERYVESCCDCVE
jgi:hypothetical protein